MANKMLIDAAHPEETRVVVLRGSRVEEFDFESASRKQLRGNIYLAKVTRVEPSLQAAFVDYGGNRHGFLAFSEIHPDYYQIPVADRQALIEAEERENAEADARAAEADSHASESDGHHDGAPGGEATASADALASAETAASEATTESEAAAELQTESTGIGDAVIRAPAEETSGAAEASAPAESDNHPPHEEPADNSLEVVSDDSVESVGAEDALEELPERRKPRMRQYKIQEVIKRRQVLLVQVVKEERGNKGAALTTYLSLAGRYSVLMPNTARGGGISRKITSPADRKRLKQVATDLDVPEGMGVILRTAGASRTKAEVKRDFEYLLRLWENVRELTLKSSAPTLVYEEGSLIKRSIRDLYNKDIDEILVAGEDSYREAKDFMRMLMPSHAKNVKPYREKQPLFARSGIEAQLDAMFSPQVTLRSGGYIVINQTEALVSIDVNSGRSTREHNIEDTAHQTNLEAADEVARQLRLRDLAGLIVIDFIDMEEKRNNRSVERKLKDALKNDRARIQVGRISHFGLLEMSRQRIRTGVLESTTTACSVCQGTGHVRAPASVALHVLRALEDQLLRGVTHHLTIRTKTTVALYILNQKRDHLSELEHRFGLHITVAADETVSSGAHFQIERGEPVEPREIIAHQIQPDSIAAAPAYEEEPEDEVEPEIEEDEDETSAEAEQDASGPESDEERHEGGERGEREDGGRRRRRRRRRGGRNGDTRNGEVRQDQPRPEQVATSGEPSDEEDDTGDESGSDESPAEQHGEQNGDPGAAGDDRQRKRRRGRRGGRRGRRNGEGNASGNGDSNGHDEAPRHEEHAERAEAPQRRHGFGSDPYAADPYEIDTTPVIEPRAPREDRPAAAEAAEVFSPATTAPVPEEPEPARIESVPEAPREQPAGKAEPVAAEPEPPQEDPNRPKRSGWWQRRSFF
jgi:ribonuclease E